VGLKDVVYVTKGIGAWRTHMNRIDRKHLDFVICDANLAPVLAVELDDSSHDNEERRERDEFLDQVLAASTLPIVHVRAKRGYVPDELRKLLAPYIKTV
jgi:very-short-patch-repair endonuclease